MAKSDGAGTPQGQERSLFLLLREAGDALEAASPPFDAAAGAARLRKAAWEHGLLRPGDIPEKDLAVTGANLEEEAPPFDVEAGAVRLREAAHARSLLSGSALEASGEATYRRLNPRVHDRDALDDTELYAEVLSAVAATDRPLTAAELDEALGIRGATVPRAAATAMPDLMVRTRRSDHQLRAGRTYCVGRDPMSDIVMTDSRVSWRHGVLRVDGNVWIMEDLGSINGTFLGLQRVDRVEISSAIDVRLSNSDDGPVLRCRPQAVPFPARDGSVPRPERTNEYGADRGAV